MRFYRHYVTAPRGRPNASLSLSQPSPRRTAVPPALSASQATVPSFGLFSSMDYQRAIERDNTRSARRPMCSDTPI
ncbi:hypothetical protein BJV78DRAFT_1190177 [Lactifluus subvellereus]|nr:hypothetical protein BJV78DRAFT_1190177 [Lactifluus subvellereus]